jgi:2,3,4,5-tetrahydropyridine-2-carboxylate N-succinyltransferase
LIEAAWDDPGRRHDAGVVGAVARVVEALDSGDLRVAEPAGGGWRVNPWVKQAVLLYFVHRDVEVFDHGPFEYRDKIPLKRGFDAARVRVVPPATVRYGAYIAPDAVLMPSYVNIGAHVGEGTMVDTWATVGSCAQIGRGVHLSGGVGIGGVLEPVQAVPVVVEDGAFVGSRCIVVEGVVVETEAVLAGGVALTASTPIIDVTGPEPVEIRGRVPARSVVVPGTRPKEFPSGTYQVACALIIGRRKASTDRKTSLNDALRDYGIPI